MARHELLVKLADLIRRKSYEFDAWLVLEAGKTWPEAEADVSEANRLLRVLRAPGVSLRRVRSVGLVDAASAMKSLICHAASSSSFRLGIFRWLFCLALIIARWLRGILSSSSPRADTPTIAAKFAEALAEAGFPEQSFSLLTGAGGAIGDVLTSHLKTRFISFTGSRRRPAYQRIGGQSAKGPGLDQTCHC